MSNFISNYLFLNQKNFEISKEEIIFFANRSRIVIDGEIELPKVFEVEKVKRITIEPQGIVIYMDDGMEIHLHKFPKGISL